MLDLAGSALRLLHRAAAPRPAPGEVHPGTPATADGATAVAVTEATLAGTAALAATFPGVPFAAAFATGPAEGGGFPADRRAEALAATGARGALAVATGLALAGSRATAFVAGDDLGGALDLLAAAARLRLPLVLHLATRSTGAAGGDHAICHAAAAAAPGVVQLFASSVQEAVDLTLIARRVAEEALVPVLLAMDGLETALAVQDVLLPSPEVIRRLVGEPSEVVHAPTPAQEMLFGRHRRRVPRWHDPERPLAVGSLFGTEAAAPAQAAGRAYFADATAAALESAFDALVRETGRRYDALSSYRVEDARVVLVARGAAVETARAVADALRAERGAGRLRVGVVGLGVLRPLPGTLLVEALRGKEAAVVLERAAPPPQGEPPLLAEVRAALGRARQGRRGRGARPAPPPLGEREVPRLSSAIYGLGGFPLRAADLAQLAREAASGGDRSPVFVGVDLGAGDSRLPKRQAFLDELHAAYPGAAELGLRAETELDAAPPGALTVAVLRSMDEPDGFAAAVADLLYRTRGGCVRSRPGVAWESWGTPLLDRLTHAPAPFPDPGDAVPVDVALWTGGASPAAGLAAAVRTGGAVVLPEASDLAAPELATLVRDRGLQAFAAPASEGTPAALRAERLLGALFGALAALDRLGVSPRKLKDARRTALGELGRLSAEDLEARLEAFLGGFEEIAAVTVEPPEGADQTGDDAPSSTLRRVAAAGTGAGSLPRFWDRTGILYREGRSADLAAAPDLAAAAVPAAASGLPGPAGRRGLLPSFDPGLCTGCGACWASCPDGAVVPLVAGASALLEGAMTLAREGGAEVEALRRVLGKLSARINREVATSGASSSAGALCDRAMTALSEEMALPEDRRAPLAEAWEAVRAVLDPLPLARTAPFFDGPEGERRGRGEVLSLAVDPDACKGCELCVAACEPGALTAMADDPGRAAAARRLSCLVAELPPPTPETVERARRSPEVGSLAAALLDPAGRTAIVPGHRAEPGSGEALAARQLLGVATTHLAPIQARQEAALAELSQRLSQAIHESLAQGLPAEDLESLARGLETLGRPDADLGELAGRIENAFAEKRVDVPRVRRLVAAARGVADLRERWARGATGGGRALYGLAVAPGPAAAWAGSFPGNPFVAPVAVDAAGDTAELARGLASGALAQAARDAAALRRARRELEHPEEAARAGFREPPLTAADLDTDERALAPPLFLLASEGALAGPALPGLLTLLAGDLPVKVLALAEADLGLPVAGATRSPGETGRALPVDLGLAAAGLAPARALVAQTSIAHPEHLAASVEAALVHPGPALLRVLAPRPARGGARPGATLDRAAAAVASRAFPLFRLTPPADPALAPELDLGSNPAEAVPGRPATPAELALVEPALASEVRPLDDADPGPLPIADWVHLERAERRGRTPFVEEAASGRRLRLSPALAAAIADRLAVWKALQRLAAGSEVLVALAAGERTSAEELAARHRTEIEALTREYEEKLARQRGEVRAELASRLHRRLVTLTAPRPAAAEIER